MTTLKVSSAPRVFLPVALGFVLFAAVLTGLSFRLPARVALHWRLDGSADAFGTPTQFVVSFGVAGVILLLLFAAVLLLVRRAPVTIMNVPYREYWKRPENVDELRALMQRDLMRIFTAVFLLLTVIVVAAAGGAIDGSSRLSWLIPVAVGVFLAGLLAYLAWAVPRRYRPPAGA